MLDPVFLLSQEYGNEIGLHLYDGEQAHGPLYTGVTSDLPGRAYQHRNGMVEGFTKRHRCKLLVWYEAYDDLQEARLRELQMKKWKRAWKVELIERDNPLWKDLYGTLF